MCSFLVGIYYASLIYQWSEKIYLLRPFLFYIYDKEHDVPLFMGRIVDPSNGVAELVQDKQSTPR